MSIDDFKYLYRFFTIGFLPGLIFFLGFEYLGSKIFHQGKFDADEVFLKSFTICFAVAFWLIWNKRKNLKKISSALPKFKVNPNKLISISLLFIVTNLLLFVMLQFIFNIIVYHAPRFNANFMLSVLINFGVLSVFVFIHFFKTRRLLQAQS